MHLQVRGRELHEARIYRLSQDSSGSSKKGQSPKLGTLGFCICNFLSEAILDEFWYVRLGGKLHHRVMVQMLPAKKRHTKLKAIIGIWWRPILWPQ